jgi:hypothetical protein
MPGPEAMPPRGDYDRPDTGSRDALRSFMRRGGIKPVLDDQQTARGVIVQNLAAQVGTDGGSYVLEWARYIETGKLPDDGVELLAEAPQDTEELTPDDPKDRTVRSLLAVLGPGTSVEFRDWKLTDLRGPPQPLTVDAATVRTKVMALLMEQHTHGWAAEVTDSIIGVLFPFADTEVPF